VEVSVTFGQDVIDSSQSKPTEYTLSEKVIVRYSASANNGISGGDNPTLDVTTTEDNLQLKRQAEDITLHKIANMHCVLDMW